MDKSYVPYMEKHYATPDDERPDTPRRGHPIAVVAERTGLSRDVLRVWERRYGAVEPDRTAGGQRLYSDQHVERFRLLAAATRHGRNIGLVATLPNDELKQLIDGDRAAMDRPSASGLDTRDGTRFATRDGTREGKAIDIVDTALACVLAYDAAKLDRVLRRAIAELGLLAVLENIIPHFMLRIGEEWVAERLTIAHEHLASAAVMAVTLDAIRTVPDNADAPRILVATPAGELHGIGAALVAAAAALDGWTIVYLGVDVPAREIAAAAEAVNARVVGLSAVYVPDPERLAREIATVRQALSPEVALLVGGTAAHAHADVLQSAGVNLCSSLLALRSELATRMVA